MVQNNNTSVNFVVCNVMYSRPYIHVTQKIASCNVYNVYLVSVAVVKLSFDMSSYSST